MNLFSAWCCSKPSRKSFASDRSSKASRNSMKIKGQVVVYSILGCSHCMRAKKLLQDENIPYIDVRLDLFPHIKEEVITKSGMKTVPLVCFNGKYFGGREQLQQVHDDPEAWLALVQDIKENPVPEDGPIIPDPSTAVQEMSLFECCYEPDEYFDLVSEMREDKVIRTHLGFFKSIESSFTGKDFMNWIAEKKGLDQKRGIQMGQALIDHKFVRPQKQGDTFRGSEEVYVLTEDDDSGALNAGGFSGCVPKSANELGELLRKMILKLYSVFLSDDGKAVDYEGMQASEEFETYVRTTRELTRVEIKSATREEKLAFFINIYNALVIHAFIERGPPTSLWGRYKFFNGTKYIIGTHPYSLQDIENGVLRANRKGIGQFSVPFGKKDPRLDVALDRCEPLIHFALVCGAKSCPPIKTYSSANIYNDLKLAAASFLENDDGCQVNVEDRTVKLSSIFKWYKEDFGSSDSKLLKFIEHHMSPGMKRTDLNELIKDGKYKISYLSYDWSTNSQS